MIAVYAILGVDEAGWISGRVLGLGALGAALVAAFVLRQSRIEHPLMPLRLFKSRNVVGANVVMAFLVAGMFSMFFLGALYLQRVLGYDPLEVGLAFLPSTVVMGTMSLRFSEPLIMRFGAKNTLSAALVFIAAGLLLFARTPVDGSYLVDVVPPLLLFGLGAGMGFPSLMMLSMSGATPSDAGLASGLINTTVQVGGAIGLAVLATLAADRTDGFVDQGEAAILALNSGFHLAYLVGAALVAIAFVVARTVLSIPSPDEMAAMHGGPDAHEAATEAAGEPDPALAEFV
jgi:predicted MFS family arabinose efflux permease